MTEQELAKVMHLLEKHYRNFYSGTNKEEVFAAWYPFFKGDNAMAVEKAVIEVICSSSFPPVVADIKRQMGEDEEEDKLTALQAFQMIADAVDDASNRKNATEAFNKLPPILREVVGTPTMLNRWHCVSDEAFNTVVMSAIRESYNLISKRETKYHTLPAGIRKTAEWMLPGKEPVALPQSDQRKTLDDLLDDMDRDTADYRAENGLLPNESYDSRVEDFLKPVTKADIARVELRDQQKIERLKNG